jgi:CBS domain-containing protein
VPVCDTVVEPSLGVIGILANARGGSLPHSGAGFSAPTIGGTADDGTHKRSKPWAMHIAEHQDQDSTRAFPFARSHVRDAMTSPIRACSPDLPLASAAELMAAERIHCLAVARAPAKVGNGHLGVITDLDLVAAASDSGLAGRTVADVAAAPAFTIASDAHLSEAASLARDLGTHHLVVVEPDAGRPVGVLSTLDLLRALAWGQPPATS